MKRSTFFAICSLLISFFTFAQTSTEVFETESSGSTTFTDNGVIFNIISHNAPASVFDIGNFANTGWSGTANDNRYIDNTGTATLANANVSFSIKTTSNLFKVNKFWVFLANYLVVQNVVGTLTITGKLSGVTKFTQTKTTGFSTTLGVTNGYTLIDLTNLNGQNYSNIVIDQLQLTVGGDYRYLGVDAFTWVKDSGIVLATNETVSPKKAMSIYPNPTSGEFSIKTESNTNAEVYNQEGKLVKNLDIKKGISEANISELPSGVYLIKTPTETHKIIKK
ncbi:putative secreted protein (Por secretion system target) [Chryseobacterium sp. 52]|uniref:T9SS type A sorting domain-containing protein n=1 Tax=Chryseobacterium sp. 52 TaxID=2035213 RepID=UPI000C19EC07|nr:T9SS type A sorting domain-containing protein [Chryseobacterium sp. 52]PIF43163.1 putative secreted protein (Por secretion system target) [Chryseobacterium sp. 52]